MGPAMSRDLGVPSKWLSKASSVLAAASGGGGLPEGWGEVSGKWGAETSRERTSGNCQILAWQSTGCRGSGQQRPSPCRCAHLWPDAGTAQKGGDVQPVANRVHPQW